MSAHEQAANKVWFKVLQFLMLKLMEIYMLLCRKVWNCPIWLDGVGYRIDNNKNNPRIEHILICW